MKMHAEYFIMLQIADLRVCIVSNDIIGIKSRWLAIKQNELQEP